MPLKALSEWGRRDEWGERMMGEGVRLPQVQYWSFSFNISPSNKHSRRRTLGWSNTPWLAPEGEEGSGNCPEHQTEKKGPLTQEAESSQEEGNPFSLPLTPGPKSTNPIFFSALAFIYKG